MCHSFCPGGVCQGGLHLGAVCLGGWESTSRGCVWGDLHAEGEVCIWGQSAKGGRDLHPDGEVCIQGGRSAFTVHILLECILVTTCNSSCGKVMFSQACVIPSVHRGAGLGGVCIQGVCLRRVGVCIQGCVSRRGSASIGQL